MLNRLEYLLDLVQEECSEVAKRASKAIRFGLDETNGRTKNNLQLLAEEYLDLLAVVALLDNELDGDFAALMTPDIIDEHVATKIEKIEKYMDYSREKGLLEPVDSFNSEDFDIVNALLDEVAQYDEVEQWDKPS